MANAHEYKISVKSLLSCPQCEAVEKDESLQKCLDEMENNLAQLSKDYKALADAVNSATGDLEDIEVTGKMADPDTLNEMIAAIRELGQRSEALDSARELRKEKLPSGKCLGIERDG